MHNSTAIDTEVSEDMAANNPVEVGTRGTVGSLVMQELKYFSQLDIGCGNSASSQQPESGVAGTGPASSKAKSIVGSSSRNAKKKRRGGSGRLLPSICSMVEVSDKNRPIGISGVNVSYRSLKSDAKKLES